ncbi:plasmid mobilization relaxosome protein MobC [Streptococcus parauberis]|uniref:plasmid mobilization protein n=1 Tax=Streptococcus parauberis TaxID=1348 RepID=UPI000CCF238F|nr:plasmid mobilization relaxosome protein MobC [Streptococcus parauberis]MDT2749380.1 plasmid mobilization relaxosome protein MobC [Streptococcus parauberis]PNY21506.1 Bacterial mobilization protein (MobC) [Streptococcus parauberis]
MDEKVKRSRSIQKLIWINEDDNLKIRKKMNQANMKNFSNYARLMLTKGQVTVVDFEGLIDFKKEVNRIGVNINQIAKGVNTGDDVSLETLEQLLNQVKEIDNNLLELIKQFEAQGD